MFPSTGGRIVDRICRDKSASSAKSVDVSSWRCENNGRPAHWLQVSEHAADVALQVLGLQAGGAHRMIGRRAPGFEDLDVVLALLGHADQHVEEIFARDVSRAAAGDQDAWGGHDLRIQLAGQCKLRGKG